MLPYLFIFTSILSSFSIAIPSPSPNPNPIPVPIPGGVISTLIESLPELGILESEGLGEQVHSMASSSPKWAESLVNQIQADKSKAEKELKIAYNDHRYAMRQYRKEHHSIYAEPDVIRSQYQRDMAAEKLRHAYKALRSAKKYT